MTVPSNFASLNGPMKLIFSLTTEIVALLSLKIHIFITVPPMQSQVLFFQWRSIFLGQFLSFFKNWHVAAFTVNGNILFLKVEGRRMAVRDRQCVIYSQQSIVTP